MLHNSWESGVRNMWNQDQRTRGRGAPGTGQVSPLQPMLEQVYLDRTATHIQPMWKQFVEDCIPWKGPTRGYWKSVIRKSGREDRLWVDPSSHFPYPGTTQGEESGSKDWSWAWEKERGWRKREYRYFVFAAKVNPLCVAEFVAMKKQKCQIKGFSFIDRLAVRTKITCSLKITDCSRNKKENVKTHIRISCYSWHLLRKSMTLSNFTVHSCQELTELYLFLLLPSHTASYFLARNLNPLLYFLYSYDWTRES